MLWGQKIKVYMDHKNLIQDALGLTSDRVYRWRLLLEEYGPEIIHIKGIHNTVTDAISWLHYCPVQNKETWMTFTQCWCYYASHTRTQQPAIHPASMNSVFANHSEEDVIYPSYSQRNCWGPGIRPQHSQIGYRPTVHQTPGWKHASTVQRNIHGPSCCSSTQSNRWYHHHLQHPRAIRLEETLRAVLYWKGMRNTIRKYVKNCHKCQVNKQHKHKYFKVPTKPCYTKPLGGIMHGPYRAIHSQRTRRDRNWLYVSDYDRPSNQLAWNRRIAGGRNICHSHGYSGVQGLVNTYNTKDALLWQIICKD